MPPEAVQQVVALVDNRAWYVLANFSETYMASIQPGMEAEVYLVSYPRRSFRGVVQGIGWANRPEDGATVGVLPEVRRTLNWVRLSNRFQVALAKQPAAVALAQGTSNAAPVAPTRVAVAAPVAATATTVTRPVVATNPLAIPQASSVPLRRNA